MATGALQTIRNGLFALGVCASLALGSFGFASHAEARVKTDDTGLLAIYCRALQQKYDDAKAVFDDVNTTFEQRAAASQDKSDARRAWNESCGEFGTIDLVFPATNGVQNTEVNTSVVGTGGVVEKPPVVHGPNGSKATVNENLSQGDSSGPQPPFKSEVRNLHFQTSN